ncbi:hypothetical protein [Aureibacter tunicatorum]|uniref:Uncharacterized protein n=1 Tax=Aureibacter tunicatorum TaxID=866807 RepID=A0AAE3XR23_9BACT|nr:hypothetical protein [Aureibacter tunicatorum]MDR6241577.1 hypothetical protein [Aureibacter tunicatorum]BDD07199.1 hypothetical protein AUTU_46820 [Aureibacter tunicatorum]
MITYHCNSKEKKRSPKPSNRNNSLSIAGPVQAYFEAKKDPKHRYHFFGRETFAQRLFLNETTETVELANGGEKNIELHYIDQERVRIAPDEMNFIVSDDLSLAVLKTSDRAKSFFAIDPLIERTGKKLVAQKAVIYLNKTGNALQIDENFLWEVEVLPDPKYRSQPKENQDAVFPIFMFRGASSDPSRYMFGAEKDENQSPYGIKLNEPFGIVSEGGNLEGDINGLRGFVKYLTLRDKAPKQKRVLLDFMAQNIKRSEHQAIDRQYKKTYYNDRKRLSAMERQFGINQFAEPHLGDSVVTFMRSSDNEDIGLFEQGNYHAGVVAESMDSQDYVCVLMRRKMEMERHQMRKYMAMYQMEGHENMTDQEVLAYSPTLMQMEDDENLTGHNSPYYKAEKMNTQLTQMPFIKMYSRTQGQTFHETAYEDEYQVPSPLTVVVAAIPREEQTSQETSAHHSETVATNSGFSTTLPPDRTCLFNNLSSRKFALEIDRFNNLDEDELKLVHFLNRHLIQYESIEHSEGNIFQNRIHCLIEMQRGIYDWHSHHSIIPMKHSGRKLPYMPQLTVVVFQLLEHIQNEIEIVLETAHQAQSIGFQLDQDEDPRRQDSYPWKTLGDSPHFQISARLPERYRLRLKGYLGQLSTFRRGRDLLNEVSQQHNGRHIFIDSPTDQSQHDFTVEIHNPDRAKPSKNPLTRKETRGTGSDVTIRLPILKFTSEASRMALGYEMHPYARTQDEELEGWELIELDSKSETFERSADQYPECSKLILFPAYIRFGRALEQALHALQGDWQFEKESEFYSYGMPWANWRNFELKRVTDTFENPSRNGIILPERTKFPHFSAYNQQGWFFPQTRERTLSDEKFAEWAVMTLSPNNR